MVVIESESVMTPRFAEIMADALFDRYAQTEVSTTSPFVSKVASGSMHSLSTRSNGLDEISTGNGHGACIVPVLSDSEIVTPCRLHITDSKGLSKAVQRLASPD